MNTKFNNIDLFFQDFLNNKIIMMLSQAARIYDRSTKIRPLNKNQRKKMYASKSISINKKIGQKKFSPFNTVSRQSRDSYLLRVTHQPNTQTNYSLNESLVLPLNRRPTIDKAKFQRIIGDIKCEDFSIQLPADADYRCIQSQTLSPQNKRPLTVRDHQKWRKTDEHFDFSKQPSTHRAKIFPKLSSLDNSTNSTLVKSLRQTIQSNFNNYDRFKLELKQNKVHSFRSDFGHEYLKQIQRKQKSPQYDILKNNEGYLRKSMAQPKGSIQFDKFREIITTRIDRRDPQWHTKLAYQCSQVKNEKSIHFDQLMDRKPNDIHSKYPIRLSLQKIIKLKGQ